MSDISTYGNPLTHCKGTEQDHKLENEVVILLDTVNSLLSFTFGSYEFLKYTVNKEIKKYFMQPKFNVV